MIFIKFKIAMLDLYKVRSRSSRYFPSVLNSYFWVGSQSDLGTKVAQSLADIKLAWGDDCNAVYHARFFGDAFRTADGGVHNTFSMKQEDKVL